MPSVPDICRSRVGVTDENRAARGMHSAAAVAVGRGHYSGWVARGLSLGRHDRRLRHKLLRSQNHAIAACPFANVHGRIGAPKRGFDILIAK